VSAPLTVWWVTTGEAGFRTQAGGLARAIAPDAQEKTIGLDAPWSWAPPALWPLTLAGLERAKDRLSPPWPDVIISCGRRAAKAAIAVRRASGGRTLAVHVQNPLAPLAQFDLVIAMRHDGISGPNVIQIDTALHDVTAEVLEAAATAWRPRFEALARPLTGVLLGGSTKRRPFTAQKAEELLRRLQAVRQGGGLAITPSRRTPEAVKAVFRQAAAHDAQMFLWDEQGDNPYRAILALSDRIVATGDSVSMVSEAIASGHPVSVFDIGGGTRHARFLENLTGRGLIGRLETGGFPAAGDAAANATPAAIEAVRRLIYARTTSSG
jgi:mitochondrial fission protein ELM1